MASPPPVGASTWLDRTLTLVNRNALAASTLVGAIALALRLSMMLAVPRPQPFLSDEFSFLLAADTFAHGRLANPAHPIWIHFETFHELMHPAYASQYPPGIGLMLALGQVVFHDPWAAVLIGMAVLCGMITWALCGWLPNRWAVAGGLMAAIQLTGSYWTESYWGGTLAAIGGALVMGALARLMRKPAMSASLAFATGLAILALSRPYEGLVLGVLCSVFLLVRLSLLLLRGYTSYSVLIGSVATPIVVTMLLTFIWIGYYNYRVTGSPLLMPYQLYAQQYTSWPEFLWPNTPRPEPKFNYEVFHGSWALMAMAQQFYRHHILYHHLTNILELLFFFCSLPVLLCVLLDAGRLLRNRSLRMPLVLLFLFYLGLAVEPNLFPHYFAPATVVIFLICAAAVRDFVLRFSPGRSRRVALAAVGLCIALLPRDPFLPSPPPRLLEHRREFIANRNFVINKLESAPGRDLVLVRYERPVFQPEWVYNDADIDRSRIVWARTMNAGMNVELLKYYRNRRAWLLDIHDDGKFTLEPINSDRDIAH